MRSALVHKPCLRNTKQIHESFGPLALSRMYARGGDGPAVRFVPTSAEDAQESADDAVDSCLRRAESRGTSRS
jgi:hypothetical protein